MKALIIGGGVAGVTTGSTLSKKTDKADITIVSSERHRYYFRPKLPGLLAGSNSLEETFAYDESWYRKSRIELKLDETITDIDLSPGKARSLKGNEYGFDYLVMACGSRPFIPPIPGVDKEGVFSVRTIDDVIGIKEYKSNVKEAVIIGGGVLGLEIGAALGKLGIKVFVLERSKWPLARQLDQASGEVLSKIMKDRGVNIITGADTDEVVGNIRVEGVRLKDGSKIPAQLCIMATGVRANVQLAQYLGLPVNRGIVVNDKLTTSIGNVFAIGDVAEHNGVCYGIIPAAIEQAKTAGSIMAGQDHKYSGTIRLNTLKVAGVFLTSMGDVHLDSADDVNVAYNEGNVYKKLMLRDGRPVGAIWLGEIAKARALSELIKKGQRISREDAENIVLGEIEASAII